MQELAQENDEANTQFNGTVKVSKAVCGGRPRKLSDLERKAQLRTAFSMFADRNGFMPVSALKYALPLVGLECPDEKTVKYLVHDRATLKFINFQIFCERQEYRYESHIRDKTLNQIFKVFDVDGDGFITMEDIKKIYYFLGLQGADADFSELLSSLSPDNQSSDKISRSTFFSVMQAYQYALREEEVKEMCKQVNQAIATSDSDDTNPNLRLARFDELIKTIRDHIKNRRDDFGNKILTVDSQYWMECDGLLFCSDADAGSAEDHDVDEVLIGGRLYEWSLKKYKDQWRENTDPTDDLIWCAKMSFQEYFSKHVLPALSEQEKKELKESTVEFYDTEEKRQPYIVGFQGGKIVDKDGNSMGEGEKMFVLDLAGRLFMAPKIRGKRHHTSFVSGQEVRSAGMIQFRADGTIVAIIARSGHYKPGEHEMLIMALFLSAQGVTLQDVVLLFQPRVKVPGRKLANLRNSRSSAVSRASILNELDNVFSRMHSVKINM